MNVRFFSGVAAVIAMAVPGRSQIMERRAQLTGSYAGQGRCTVAVTVDGAAEVEVHGDTAVLRNLSGQQPEWRQFTCNAAMPGNLPDFRLAGVNGRGKVQLVRDPRNGGVAVVRIEDPQGGAGGYTFDLTWSNGPGSPGGQGRDQRDNQGRDPRDYQRGDQGRDPRDDRDHDRDGQFNRPFSPDQAVRVCQDAIRQQAAQNFRSNDIAFRRTTLDDNPGRRDWIVGAFDVRRGYDRVETYRFSCSVDFGSGRVRSAQIDAPDNGGYRPDDNRPNPSSVAIQSCQRAVEDRLRRNGYGRVDFRSIRVDDRPGRNDRIVGDARAGDRDRSDSFDFSCSVDLNDGDVRSVDVRPH